MAAHENFPLAIESKAKLKLGIKDAKPATKE